MPLHWEEELLLTDDAESSGSGEFAGPLRPAPRCSDSRGVGARGASTGCGKRLTGGIAVVIVLAALGGWATSGGVGSSGAAPAASRGRGGPTSAAIVGLASGDAATKATAAVSDSAAQSKPQRESEDATEEQDGRGQGNSEEGNPVKAAAEKVAEERKGEVAGDEKKTAQQAAAADAADRGAEAQREEEKLQQRPSVADAADKAQREEEKLEQRPPVADAADREAEAQRVEKKHKEAEAQRVEKEHKERPPAADAVDNGGQEKKTSGLEEKHVRPGSDKQDDAKADKEASLSKEEESKEKAAEKTRVVEETSGNKDDAKADKEASLSKEEESKDKAAEKTRVVEETSGNKDGSKADKRASPAKEEASKERTVHHTSVQKKTSEKKESKPKQPEAKDDDGTGTSGDSPRWFLSKSGEAAADKADATGKGDAKADKKAAPAEEEASKESAAEKKVVEEKTSEHQDSEAAKTRPTEHTETTTATTEHPETTTSPARHPETAVGPSEHSEKKHDASGKQQPESDRHKWFLSKPSEAAGDDLDAEGKASSKPRWYVAADAASQGLPVAADKKEEVNSKCSPVGRSCNETKCCRDPGFQCYVKDAGWAECRARCVPGPDPRGADGGPWSCKKLGERAAGEVPKCAKAGQNCATSHCCVDSGMQCYEKVSGFATCKTTCTPGMDLTDVDPTPWTCKQLGSRTPDLAKWVYQVCAAPGTSCQKKGCCSTPGAQCVTKNPYYAECQVNCTEGWECKTIGQRTPFPAPKAWEIPEGKVAPWVAKKCSGSGESCLSPRCCSSAGEQCFAKNETLAVCKASCATGLDLYDTDPSPWSCAALGPKTPGAVDASALEPWKRGVSVADWVAETCGETFTTNCGTSRCCKDVGKRCFEKDEFWATCRTSCLPGLEPGDEGNWTCKELGPRTLRPWGKPSLYCFSVVQPFNYEPGLIKAQAEKGVGIFGCDQHSVFSTKKFYIGDGPLGPVNTHTFVPAKVVQSKDNTAGNAELFMHVWDSVRNLGLFQDTDWTIKVDPDAVLLADRLRGHLKPHTGQSVYIVNCAKAYMPEGPMMFGALEAIAKPALQTYFWKAGDCVTGLAWKKWGEDLFMGKCLEKLGVQRRNDFHIYSDGVCTGVDCRDPDAAAFHPKKDIGSWMACLNATKNPKPRPSTPAPQWFKDYMDSYAR